MIVMGVLKYTSFCKDRYSQGTNTHTRNSNANMVVDRGNVQDEKSQQGQQGQHPINNFTVVDWMRVPGIGKTLARRLVEHAPYNSMDAVVAVRGVSERILDKLNEVLTLRDEVAAVVSPGEAEASQQEA